jgi:competence protein ComEA
MIFENFDELIFKFRYYIGGILIFIILAGIGMIGFDKYNQNNIKREQAAIVELKMQNESLRQQLSKQSIQQVAGVSTSTEQISSKININTAGSSELDKIPGVGPARAADIIMYRESKGGFKTIEEIKNIKGIGDKTFESMKDLITAGN